MNPKGFDDAPLMTSHTSIFMWEHINAISLASAMLTLRNVFSSSLTISATRVDDTGTICFIADPYSSDASSTHRGVVPPTTFGISLVENLLLPGSTRSGE